MSDVQEVERLDLGRVARETLRILRQRFAPMVLIALVVAGVPIALLQDLQVRSVQAGGEDIWPTVNFLLGSIVAGALATSIITPIAVGELKGRPLPAGEALRLGLARFAEVSVASMIVFVATGVGMVALIVPGVMIACAWFVWAPVIVVERPGIARTLERSQKLTQGNRLLIAALVIAYTTVVTAIAYATSGSGLEATADVRTGPVQIAIDAVFTAVSQSVSIVGVTVVYAELRRIRDGAPPFGVAEIFD